MEDVRLDNEAFGDFVPVTSGSKTYYGGDQSWYSTSTKRSRGCGPVAAANITCYLARKDSGTYGDLYLPSSMSKSDFITHMDNLYDAIDPGLLGEKYLCLVLHII